MMMSAMPDTTVTKTKTTQVRISGFGGQGIVLAGMLLGKAASLYDGKEAVFTQAYGPEARGGASNADVIVSDTPIGYPLLTRPDVVVAMFQEAYARFRPGLREGGTLIIESDLVHPAEDDTAFHGIAASKIAEELGRRIVANVVVLGYLVGLTDVVSRKSVERAIETTVKPGTIDLNFEAFAAGYDRARQELRP